MKCLILAAGYATRLYPLTENFPKPLLDVAGKPILDWLIDDMSQTGLVDEYVVISNHKFAPIFEEWAAKKHSQLSKLAQGVPNCSQGYGNHNSQLSIFNSHFLEQRAQSDACVNYAESRQNCYEVKFSIVDDGTSSNETRLGAVKDIQFAIEQLHLDDDLLVMAGDNLLDFSLAAFIRYAQQKNATCVMRYYEADETKLRRSGVAEVAADDRILSMEEKPAQPKSHWCMPAFYYYTRHDSRLIQQAIDAGCGTDAPGSFISWLCTQTNVYAWEMPGKRYDIGNLASYEEVKKVFKSVTK